MDASLEAPALGHGGSSPRLSTSVDWGGRQTIVGRFSASLTGGGGALAAALHAGGGADLEQPLLPGGEEAEQQYVEHVLEPKPWPTLRGSSVSTRRSECGPQAAPLGTCILVGLHFAAMHYLECPRAFYYGALPAHLLQSPLGCCPRSSLLPRPRALRTPSSRAPPSRPHRSSSPRGWRAMQPCREGRLRELLQ